MYDSVREIGPVGMSDPELDACSDGDVADALAQLLSAEAATRAALCRLVVAFDRREAWGIDGATSMAHWLTIRSGMRFAHAVDIVRVAHEP
ncbi:MAG: hypothetical protein ACRD0U_11660 [Acidimicrobiales bacterium]